MSDQQTAPTPGDAADGDAIRASDGERAATVERLKQAHDEGRLTLDEFTERIAKAREARTRGSLDALVADLPEPAPASATAGTGTGGQTSGTQTPEWHIAPIGGWKQRGHWKLDRDIVAVTVLGGIDLDLTDAQFARKQVTLTKISVLGGTEIRVPRDVRVKVEGLTVLGGHDIQVEEPTGIGAPTLLVRAFGLIGGIRVRNS